MQIISRDAYNKLSKITDPEEYHDALKSLRLVPKDRPYVDPAFYKKSVAALKPYTDPKTGIVNVEAALGDRRVAPAYIDTVLGAGAVARVREWIAGEPERYRVSLIDWFAKNLGMSKKAAKKTIADYKANPNDPRFKTLPVDSIQALNMAAQMDDTTNLVVVGQDEQGRDLVMTASQYAVQQEFERWIASDEAPDDMKDAWEAGNIELLNMLADKHQREYEESQAILSTLQSIPGAYTSQEVMPEGVYGPPKPESYDYVAALMSGEITADQLKKLGLDKSFVNATQDYATQVQGLIDKFDQGVKPTGSGLSRGIDLTGSEAIDLGTAIREAGLNIEGGSAVNTWRDMTDEQKYQVASVLAGYPRLGGVLPSTYRGLQSVTTDEDLGFAPKLGLTLVTAPAVAIIAPFVKDMTVGELKQKVDPYANTGADGKITDYNLTQYLKDNPYDAPLLARGGFSVDDIEKAQEGKQVKAMPEGATPLDWVIAGVMVASVALPVLRFGAMAAGTRLIQPVMSPGLRLGTMAIMQNIYRGAALGETAIKYGLPAGMTTYTVANWNKMTPEQRAVAGVFTGLTYIPLFGTAIRALKGTWRTFTTAGSPGGILPRGLTTGYQDVYAVRPPPDFFAGTPKGKLIEIYTSGKYSPTQQITEVANLMTPQTGAAFLTTVKMAQSLSQFKVPSSMHQPLAPTIQKIGGFNQRTAAALADYFRANKGKVIIGGSAADDLQGMGAGAQDLDLYTVGLTPEQVKEAIRNIITLNGDKFDPKLWKDIHPHDSASLGMMPYDFAKLTPKPVTVDGASVISMGEQFLRRANSVVTPARGGMMGPAWDSYFGKRELAGLSVSTHIGRAKDIFRLQFEAQIAINILKATDPTKAASLQSMLDKFSQYQKLTVEGRTTPIPEKELAELEQVFSEATREVQKATLIHGMNAILVNPDTGLVLSKIISPAGQVLPGTVYFAAKDLTANIEMLKKDGSWRPTQRQVFFSPEAAYDFLIDRTTGKLGPNAGIIALRTDPKVDMAPGGIITGPFRYEHIDGKAIVYNELVSEGEFYATEPNARALSDDGVTGGVTGESVTYYPRRKTKVPILWTATKAAQMKGLGAPSEINMHEISYRAWRETFKDLLPKNWHWSDVTTSEVPASIRANLIEFYQKTYRVKQLPPEKLAIMGKGATKKVRTEAITDLRSRGEARTEDNIRGEARSIYLDKLTNLYKSLAKATGANLDETLISTFAASMAKGADVPVEEMTGMLETLDSATREKLVKVAQGEYDTAIQQLSPEAAGAFANSDAVKRLYYLNLGKISTKLAAWAATMSILNATAPAIASTVVPATRIPSTEPVPTTAPTIVGGITTPPTMDALTTPRTTPTVLTVPTTPTTLPPTTVTGITIPTVPTTPTIPTTPTTPTTPPTLPPTPTTPTTPVTPTPTPIPKPPKPKPRAVIKLQSDGSKVAELPDGSIAWKQGWTWKWIPKEDWQRGAAKPRSLARDITPMGALRTDLRTTDETIQVIGDPGAAVPDIDVDLGIGDIFIRDNAQTITFGGHGLKTNVGEGVDSPAKGMTVGGGGAPAKGHAYARKVYPANSFSATDVSKEEPIRGGGVREIRGKDREDIRERTEKMLAGEEPETAPAEPKEETIYFDETKEFDDRFKMPWEDGEGYYIDEYVAGRRNGKHRPSMKKKRPNRRGGDTPTTLRGLRL